MRSYPFNCVGCHPIHTLIAGYIPYIHLYTIYPAIYTFLIIIMVYLPNKHRLRALFLRNSRFRPANENSPPEMGEVKMVRQGDT